MWEGYHGGGGKPKKWSKEQIRDMVNNMKKSKIVKEKSDKYHKNEEKDAEKDMLEGLKYIN